MGGGLPIGFRPWVSAWSSSAPASEGWAWPAPCARPGSTDVTILERADDGRRGVARQHLPRRGVRRTVAALLLVVGDQPELGPALLGPARDPRLHPTHRRRRGPAGPGPHRHRGHRARVRRRRVAGHHEHRRRRRRPGRLRHRPAVEPGRAADSPARTRSPARCSTPRSGATTSTSPASGSRWSAPARARSSSCPGSWTEVRSMTVFQRSAPYVVPKPDRGYTSSHHRLFEKYPAVPARRAAADLLDHRAVQRRARGHARRSPGR